MLSLLVFGYYQSLAERQHSQEDSLYLTRFTITSLPFNTPHDATIYLATESRGWFPDLEMHKFSRADNGQYELLLHHNSAQFEYKITRGSWDAVEGRSNGRARDNRKLVVTDSGGVVTVALQVMSWEDLSPGSYRVYVYLLYLAVLQAILLIISINTVRNKNKLANKILSVLLLLVALALVGRASSYDRDIFNWVPKILLVPEIILFTYAPFFYLYIHHLLKLKTPPLKILWVHFLPAILHVFFYLPYILIADQAFIYRVIDRELFEVFAASGAVALFFNLLYWIACRRVIREVQAETTKSKEHRKYVNFLKTVLQIKAGYLLFWFLLAVVFAIGKIINVDTLWVVEIGIDILWVLFSLITVCLAYYAMRQPEIFTIDQLEKKSKVPVLPSDEFEKVKVRLSDLINKEKVYTDPELTLPELSLMVPTTVHTLSRVINEGFNQTFSQFINEKRIMEFIQVAKSEKENHSFLSLAFKVGFNSKTTFNRSFKKYTGTTPRLYFSEDS